MSDGGMQVVAGELVALRLFDVAFAIDLAQAQATWSTHVDARARRSQLERTPAKAMRFGVAPLQVELPESVIELGGRTHALRASARLYEFGVIALSLSVPVNDMHWNEYVDAFAALEQQLGAEADDGPWTQRLERLQQIIGPALQRPSLDYLQEDYLLARVHATAPELDAQALTAHVDLAGLLAADERPLSPAAREEILRHSLSYYADDLTVLNWDRAFLFDRAADNDVVDVIEVANVQLLELRYYENLLDKELPNMYRQVLAARGALSLLAARRYAHLARRLYTLAAEVTELGARVDNVLQVTEDVYLARVYAVALERFRVRSLSAAVAHRLGIVRDTYTALYDEASSRRAEWLEATIVLLILIEIVLALWHV